ncbi:hypothetical protein BV898_12700 [Hypsibius exemplaris]|uniref:C2H2-type domain-containing protein n=1 Tax=Hypsibius exemplaris TaxID=2072580 RepID=A0A1W0WD11_HYPEX|nr:hypothetical protein BV898_12700 [Hypsibius exemplaris]
MPGGNDIKKPKLESPCGYMSELEYEKVWHGDVCIEAMKACKEIPHFTCDCGNPFTGKSICLAHRKICHGDKMPFVCPVRGCFFDAVTFCQAIEHARGHILASPSPPVDSTATTPTSLNSVGSPPQQHSVSDSDFSLSNPTAARHGNVVAAEFIDPLTLVAPDGNDATGSHSGTSTMLFPGTLISEGNETRFRRKV